MKTPFGCCPNRVGWSQLTFSPTDGLHSVAAAKCLQVLALVERYTSLGAKLAYGRLHQITERLVSVASSLLPWSQENTQLVFVKPCTSSLLFQTRQARIRLIEATQKVENIQCNSVCDSETEVHVLRLQTSLCKLDFETDKRIDQ